MENGTVDAMVILNELQAEGVDISKAVEYLESIISNTDQPEVSSI